MNILAVNTERLGRWIKKLTENKATAQVIVGIGHEKNSGKVVVLATEDGPNDYELAMLCEEAARQLKDRFVKSN